MVSLVVSMPVICQLLRVVGSLVRAGEVGDKLLLKVDPSVDAALWQVIQPDSGWSFKNLWYISHCPSKVSSCNVHYYCIVF
jgi:hypothetical protein